MDWFSRLTGFKEGDYSTVQSQLSVQNGYLFSKVNGSSYATGFLEIISLNELRKKCEKAPNSQRSIYKEVYGDVRRLHSEPDNEGALFQVASQFNLLEMMSPKDTPEDGVTRYAFDLTQGPACAIAAGAATIYRNYFVNLGSQVGQTSKIQINTLSSLEVELALRMGMPEESILPVRNGYALPERDTLRKIEKYLSSASNTSREALKNKLQIGIQWDVEVTESAAPIKPVVSQAFCSALPIAYSLYHSGEWAQIGCLVLEAAYEATLCAGVINKIRGVSNVVYLTSLGGGAFGNPESWITNAMQAACSRVSHNGLDIRLLKFRR